MKIKPAKQEVLKKVMDILNDNCADPVDELKRTGKALMEIGEALEGQSVTDARQTLRAVAILQGFEV